ncbi:glycosyltransferase family 4 protein [Phormidium sp. CCY1219]|uniref:glycosyltransferase family 4 protein n=1 Tax=Phormidium sp. CCY1219 TaxID=2886104 RepID=UPI002D1F66BC|nr:glycosyltransferase [Phormidium sp. CCY1219]MEB3830091.1 glycosyltransferase [Phormidium sp. CCY1219]
MRLLLFNLATDVDDPILGFATRWIAALAEHVESIDVITMRSGKIEVPQNVWVHSVGKEKGYSEPRRAIEFYRILGRLLAEQHYDACFAHMMPLFAVMAAPFLRLKKIHTVLWYTHKSVTPILRLATVCVDRVVTASKESFRIPSSKVRVIGHGIDTEKFVPKRDHLSVPLVPPFPKGGLGGDRSSRQRPFTILTVGRLSPIKRVELLVEAIALLREKKPDMSVCLKIVGGPASESDKLYEDELKNQVEQYQLQDTVFWAGSIPFPQVVDYYQQADCFVNLCPTGGMDKAVLEAMSCELVVVVANQTFIRVMGTALANTWVIDGSTEKLCDRLLLLLSMTETYQNEMATKLRNIVVTHHSLTGLVANLIEQFVT